MTFVNFKDIPAPSASILVAIAKKNRHFKVIHVILISSCENALFINLIDKNIKTEKTIHFENISNSEYIQDDKYQPIIGNKN